MSRVEGQSVSDARMPRGLRLVDESVAHEATANDAAVVAAGTRVPPPSTLPERLHEQWDELTASLADAGLMAAADSPMVMILLREIDLYVRAADEAVREGTVIWSEKGQPLQHPAHSLAIQHAKAAEQIAKSLGVTFVARARLDPQKSQENVSSATKNPFAV